MTYTFDGRSILSQKKKHSQFLLFIHSLEILMVIWDGGNDTDIWWTFPAPRPRLHRATPAQLLRQRIAFSFTICCNVNTWTPSTTPTGQYLMFRFHQKSKTLTSGDEISSLVSGWTLPHATTIRDRFGHPVLSIVTVVRQRSQLKNRKI